MCLALLKLSYSVQPKGAHEAQALAEERSIRFGKIVISVLYVRFTSFAVSLSFSFPYSFSLFEEKIV